LAGEERRAPAIRAEEELARLLAEVRTLEGVADALRDMVVRTQAYLAELRAAGTTLEAIAGQESAEVLVPVGAGSFVWARVAKPDRAVITLGADVAVEVDVERAKEILGDRAAEAQKALQEHLSRLAEVERALEARRQRIRALAGAAELARGAEERAEKGP